MQVRITKEAAKLLKRVLKWHKQNGQPLPSASKAVSAYFVKGAKQFFTTTDE